MADRILSAEAKDVTDELTKHLSEEGIDIITNASINNVRQEKEKVRIEFEKENQR